MPVQGLNFNEKLSFSIRGFVAEKSLISFYTINPFHPRKTFRSSNENCIFRRIIDSENNGNLRLKSHEISFGVTKNAILKSDMN